MKQVLGMAATFTLGLAFALAWAALEHRGREAPSPTCTTSAQVSRVETPLLVTPSPSPSEEPDRTLAVLDEVASQVLDGHAVTDEPDVKSWDEFYEATRILGITDVDLLRQIIHRLGRELDLPYVDTVHLEQLVVREQLAATRSALRRYGDSIAALTASKGASATAFWEELRGLRKEVRDRFEAEYMTRFHPDQMAVINRHLRNDRLEVMEYQQGPVSRFLVSGFGR